jgi:hypothetical protein
VREVRAGVLHLCNKCHAARLKLGLQRRADDQGTIVTGEARPKLIEQPGVPDALGEQPGDAAIAGGWCGLGCRLGSSF